LGIKNILEDNPVLKNGYGDPKLEYEKLRLKINEIYNYCVPAAV